MNDTTVLCARPPWAWNDKLPGNRGATAHIETHTLEQIAHAELPHLQPNAVLFLWRSPSRLSDALEVCHMWGFEPKTELVWIKTTSQGNRAFGMGRIVRGEHETCLIATKGKPQVASKSVRSTFTAPVGKAMEAPEEFYRLVDEMYPTPYSWTRTATEWSHGWHLRRASGMYTKTPSVPVKTYSVRPARMK